MKSKLFLGVCVILFLNGCIDPNAGPSYDGTYKGTFWSATPCAFPPCDISTGPITVTVSNGKVSGGALQGTIGSDGVFTGTWSSGVSAPFVMSMHPNSPNFSYSTIALVGPTSTGMIQGTLSCTISIVKSK